VTIALVLIPEASGLAMTEVSESKSVLPKY